MSEETYEELEAKLTLMKKTNLERELKFEEDKIKAAEEAEKEKQLEELKIQIKGEVEENYKASGWLPPVEDGVVDDSSNTKQEPPEISEDIKFALSTIRMIS